MPLESKTSIIIGMRRDKGTFGTLKCRKFTALVDVHKTMLAGRAALTGDYCPPHSETVRDSRYIYNRNRMGRKMIRRSLAAGWVAAGLVLALHPTPAHAGSASRAAKHHGQASQQGSAPAPQHDANWTGEVGHASYYGKAHHGRRTASGDRFDQRSLTAAHPYLPFGTRVRVTNAATGRSVVVTITDRLYSRKRVVDLSVAAAQELGMIRQGVALVQLEPV